jgi:hypothetical protein
MRTVNGIFGDPDAALGAGERAREVVGPRATIRVFLPRSGRNVIETSVVADNSSWPRMALVCVAIGLAGVVLLAALKVPSLYVILWLSWSVLSGVMFAAWFTGELHPRRLLSVNGEARSRYEAEVRSGKAVVTAVVRTTAEADAVMGAFQKAGGTVVDGIFAEPRRASRPAGATS